MLLPRGVILQKDLNHALEVNAFLMLGLRRVTIQPQQVTKLHKNRLSQDL